MANSSIKEDFDISPWKTGAIRSSTAFVCLFGFYRISAIVGYLRLNPFLYK